VEKSNDEGVVDDHSNDVQSLKMIPLLKSYYYCPTRLRKL